jgi:hypothetical protein
MLGIDRRLAGKRPKDCRREPRVTVKKPDQDRKRDGTDHDVGQRRYPIEGIFKKAAGEADKIAGE